MDETTFTIVLAISIGAILIALSIWTRRQYYKRYYEKYRSHNRAAPAIKTKKGDIILIRGMHEVEQEHVNNAEKLTIAKRVAIGNMKRELNKHMTTYMEELESGGVRMCATIKIVSNTEE
jgi:uridine kinase